MFSGIKPAGAFPLAGAALHSAPAAGHANHAVVQQNYDQFQCSAQLDGDETRLRDTVSSLLQKTRTRPTRSEMETLRQQVQSGTYQPDAKEIAARMMMVNYQED